MFIDGIETNLEDLSWVSTRALSLSESFISWLLSWAFGASSWLRLKPLLCFNCASASCSGGTSGLKRCGAMFWRSKLALDDGLGLMGRVWKTSNRLLWGAFQTIEPEIQLRWCWWIPNFLGSEWGIGTPVGRSSKIWRRHLIPIESQSLFTDSSEEKRNNTLLTYSGPTQSTRWPRKNKHR